MTNTPAAVRTRFVLAVVAFLPVLGAGGVPAAPGADTTSAFRSPTALALSADGSLLYVSNATSGSVSVIDTATLTVKQEITGLGSHLSGIALVPHQPTLLVCDNWGYKLLVVALASGKKTAEVPVGAEPVAVAVTPDGRTAFVSSASADTVDVIDLSSRKRVQQISVGSHPRELLLDPTGQHLFVVNTLGNSISVVDAMKQTVVLTVPIAGHVLRGITIAPQAKTLVVAHQIAHNDLPTRTIWLGQVWTNAITVVRLEGDKPKADTLCLDNVREAAANPWGVAVLPNRGELYVALSGCDKLGVVNLAEATERTRALVRNGIDPARAVSNFLGLRRIPVGRNPRAVLASASGDKVYVANYLGDSISVVDTAADRVVSTVELGSQVPLTAERRGEIIFNDATRTLDGWFSCNSCHPEGHTSGLNWDFYDDGVGSYRNVRTLREVMDTPPFRWQGQAAEVGRDECAPTFTGFMQAQALTQQELSDVVAYISSLRLPPNPYRLPDGSLSPAAQRGKAIFEDPAVGCAQCHPAALFTDLQKYDVGTGTQYDLTPEFDVPSLKGTYNSRPYLHDGRAASLEEIFTKFNPQNKHGQTSGLSLEQLGDLLEYLRTL